MVGKRATRDLTLVQRLESVRLDEGMQGVVSDHRRRDQEAPKRCGYMKRGKIRHFAVAHVQIDEFCRNLRNLVQRFVRQLSAAIQVQTGNVTEEIQLTDSRRQRGGGGLLTMQISLRSRMRTRNSAIRNLHACTAVLVMASSARRRTHRSRGCSSHIHRVFFRFSVRRRFRRVHRLVGARCALASSSFVTLAIAIFQIGRGGPMMSGSRRCSRNFLVVQWGCAAWDCDSRG